MSVKRNEYRLASQPKRHDTSCSDLVSFYPISSPVFEIIFQSDGPIMAVQFEIYFGGHYYKLRAALQHGSWTDIEHLWSRPSEIERDNPWPRRPDGFGDTMKEVARCQLDEIFPTLVACCGDALQQWQRRIAQDDMAKPSSTLETDQLTDWQDNVQDSKLEKEI